LRYIPNSPDERADMLRQLGVATTDNLFDSIPEELRLRDHLNVPAAMSELELLKLFEEMGARNEAARRVSFLGGGAYSHYSPTIVDHLISRSEFFTAYTPYQPEISQGTLQAIFEFQTLVCQLTGMDIANASMYDGSTAMAEAVLMAERVTKRTKVIVSSAVHPQYLEVAHTYVQHAGIDLEVASFDSASGLVAGDAGGCGSRLSRFPRARAAGRPRMSRARARTATGESQTPCKPPPRPSPSVATSAPT